MKKKIKKIRTSAKRTRELPSHKKARASVLKKLEKRIVEQKEDDSEKDFEELEHEVSEEPGESSEGLGIEEEESRGEVAYPEIEKAEKIDADEEEEE